MKFLNYNHAVSQEKTPPPLYILNNSAKNEPILIVVGVQNHEKISHKNIVNLPRLNNVAALPCEMQK